MIEGERRRVNTQKATKGTTIRRRKQFLLMVFIYIRKEKLVVKQKVHLLSQPL